MKDCILLLDLEIDKTVEDLFDKEPFLNKKPAEEVNLLKEELEPLMLMAKLIPRNVFRTNMNNKIH